MRRNERTADFEEILRTALDCKAAGMWTACPGIVTAVNLGAQTVSVQPAIQGKQTAQDGIQTDVNMPLLVDVPIVWPRAGGFALTFPVAAGDECLVVFGSRCIDSWWQTGDVGPQAEQRMHDLSDGFAIFAPASQAKVLDDVSDENVQLRDEDGTTFLEITPDGEINITAVTEQILKSPKIKVQDNAGTTFLRLGYTAGTIDIISTSAVNLVSPSVVLGQIGGTITALCTIEQPLGIITSGGVNLTTHKHQETGSVTGSPQNA